LEIQFVAHQTKNLNYCSWNWEWK